MNRIHHMAAPPGNLSNAPIMIKPELLAGKSTIKTSTEMANVQAQAAVLRQNQAISSPDEKPSVMVTLGQTNRPVTVVPKVPTVSTVSTDGFSSGSAEYALSVIGVLCIVYGIVAK
jgi:hypothetical protein